MAWRISHDICCLGDSLFEVVDAVAGKRHALRREQEKRRIANNETDLEHYFGHYLCGRCLPMKLSS